MLSGRSAARLGGWELGVVCRVHAQRCRRETRRVGSELSVWGIAHGQFERGAVGDLRVPEPDLVKRLSIEPDILYVLVVARIVVRDDDKIASVFEMDGYLVED